ncbi:MAG: hypothetical protein V3S89_13705 [Desulfobacterales bacterium]
MDKLSELVLDYTRCEGALAAGIATTDTLAGGPPSTDLSYVLGGARSAVVFAIGLDQDLIPDYLGKVDRLAFEQNYEQANSIASGVGVKLANFMTQKGQPTVALAANDVYRDDTPRGRGDMLPPISLRYLAAVGGVGSFGLSGNIITDKNGGAIILGGVVTQAELIATDALAEEDNYCDSCGLCKVSCASGLMKPEEKINVTLGGRTFSYADRRSYLRCQYVCGGFTGLHPDGKWSTWSPGRFAIPDDDNDMMPLFLNSINAYNSRPDTPGGHYHSLMASKLYSTCANCQLICVPDKEERKRRYKLLTQNGVVVQHPDGSIEAMSSDDATQFLDKMPPDTRALYENIES